jgi:hypothetical protein
MKKQLCPDCPDGQVWTARGPTGEICPTCLGTAFLLEEDDDNYPFCDCGAVHSGIEDGGRCEACGKII